MVNSIQIGLSGAVAAGQRLETTASNVANIRTPSVPNQPLAPQVASPANTARLFRPAQTVQTNLATGGVSAFAAPVVPPSVPEFNPDGADAGPNGLVNRPNIDPARTAVDQLDAVRQLQANLITIRAGDQVLKTALDVKA
ncbi:MAG: hypothetical protein HYR63_03800 [Proteobacteria bacterium]|nr:hypothetical protein [Pseudomonadota bacterium]